MTCSGARSGRDEDAALTLREALERAESKRHGVHQQMWSDGSRPRNDGIVMNRALLSPFEHRLEQGPAIPDFRPQCLLVGRHEPSGLHLAPERSIAAGLEAGIALGVT